MQQAGGIMDAMSNTQGNSADASLGGMAQAVDTKVEAYRNNPQALEKRLAGNQQLLDLLALQKVKSEKEAAANQLKLGEQQNPNTIIEQREQEVLDMTKNDMVAQTAGILGQRQKQQQKNMQRTATGGNAPMMAARGGLLPLPRPNMQNMAQGGIIGYDGGGPVGHTHPHSAATSAEDVPEEAVVQEEDAPEDFKPLKALGEGASALGNLIKNNPVEALSVGLMFVPGIGWGMAGYRAAKAINYAVKAKKAYDTSKKGIAATGQVLKKAVTKPKSDKLLTDQAKRETTGPVGEAARSLGIDKVTGIGPKVGRELSPNRIGAVGVGIGAANAGIGALNGEEVEAQANPEVGPEVVTEDLAKEELTVTPDDTAYSDGTKEIADRTAPDRTGIASNLFEQSMPEGLLKSYQDRMGADVSEAQKKARAESDVYTRREENRGELESGIAAQRAFQQRQLDPKKLQNDRLMANLIGGGQRGLLGAAMGGQQADAQVATFEGNQIKEVNRLTNEKIARDIDASKIGEANARQVYASLTADKSAAANALKDVTKQNLLEKSREGQIAFETWKEKNDRDQKVLDSKFNEQKADILENSNKAGIIGDLLALQEKMNTSYRESIAMDPAYRAGPALEQRALDANAQGKDVDFSEDEKNMFIRYQSFMSNIQDGSKAYGELEAEIKKLAGYNDI